MTTPSTHFDQFEFGVQALRSKCGGLDRHDLLTSILISDLWLRNVASQVKHQLLYAIALERRPHGGAASQPIASYTAFSALMAQLIASLPAMPMLEDFVPEADWGDVAVWLDQRRYHLFYGSSFERVADFIEAYRLLYGNDGPREGSEGPIEDLRRTLAVQDELLRTIPKAAQLDASALEPGHIEVPPEAFWKVAAAAINTMSATPVKTTCSPEYVIGTDDKHFDLGYQAFGDGILTGKFLPYLFAETGRGLIPISPRNSVPVVFDRWNRELKSDVSSTAGVAARIGEWVGRRFVGRECMVGHITVVAKYGSTIGDFCAAVFSPKYVYLIHLIAEEPPHEKRLMKQLQNLDLQLEGLMKKGIEWSIGNFTTRQRLEFASSNDRPPSVRVLGLLVRISTESDFIDVPRLKCSRVFPLTDFVTVIDSLQDAAQLDRYLSFFDQYRRRSGHFAGPADWLGAFFDTTETLVDGAREPDFIALDPHWGSRYRYNTLAAFWGKAPRRFPDADARSWRIESGEGSRVTALDSRGKLRHVRCVAIGEEEVHVDPDFSGLDLVDAKRLDLFAQCLSDTLATRAEMLIPCERWFARCRVIQPVLGKGVSRNPEQKPESFRPGPWIVVLPRSPDLPHTVSIRVDLDRFVNGLDETRDASLEVEILLSSLHAVAESLAETVSTELEALIQDTASRQPRFMSRMIEKPAAFPEDFLATRAQGSDFKSARKLLAIHFMRAGVKPGRYELAEAKKAIDSGRASYLAALEEEIATFNFDTSIQRLVSNNDAIYYEYWRNHADVATSLAHEVDYDRNAKLDLGRQEFDRTSRASRYLIEKFVLQQPTGRLSLTDECMKSLYARADWLLTLYSASDVLHYGIDVGGIDLTEDLVPEVFYSEKHDERERQFGQEIAALRLGVGVNANDRPAKLADKGVWVGSVDAAMIKDTGFSFIDLGAALHALAFWPSTSESAEEWPCYSATAERICSVLTTAVSDLSAERATKIVEFLTLKADRVAVLAGKRTPELDVPIWEYRKRHYRYTLRPLISVGRQLLWGPCAAERALSIWSGAFMDGHLPAELPWPSVEAILESRKSELDEHLEECAESIVKRFTTYVARNVSPHRMFRGGHSAMPDLGDFDVLGYIPDRNIWLAIECKNNSKPFCLKDAKRLRGYIYGKSPTDHGHMGKIERRINALKQQHDDIRAALRWPAATSSGSPIRAISIYATTDLVWWMREVSQELSAEFVQIDALDSWLRTRLAV